MSSAFGLSFKDTDQDRISEVGAVAEKRIAALDPIAERLQGEAVIPYLEIKTTTRLALIDGLRGVKRWSTTPYKMDPDWRENNLDHVLELIDWANELAARFPALKAEICEGKEDNWMDLLTMLILHDIGEIQVGDICVSDPRFEKEHGRKHKRKESYAAHLILGKEELVGEHSARLRGLYHRFGRKHQRDKLVMLGNLFDKGQATQNVARHQIRFNLDNPEYSVKQATTKNMARTLQFMVDTMASLSGTKTRQEMGTFTSEKVLRAFDDLGMPEVDIALKDIRRQFADMCIIL